MVFCADSYLLIHTSTSLGALGWALFVLTSFPFGMDVVVVGFKSRQGCCKSSRAAGGGGDMVVVAAVVVVVVVGWRYLGN